MSGELLYIFCEGHTEEATIKNFLQPFWSQRFDHCEVRRYDGAPDLKTNFVKDVRQELGTEKNVSVLCILDLYEEPFGVYEKAKMTHSEGFEAVRQQLMSRIPPDFHHRFAGFPIVMEPETWLLADPVIQGKLGQEFPVPEEIEHPAQQFKKWRSNYNKRIDGKELFQRASSKRIYEDNCPHFNLLIDWLITEQPQPHSSFDLRFQEWQSKQNELQLRHDEAVRATEEALEKGDIDEAEKWDELRIQREQEITDHARWTP